MNVLARLIFTSHGFFGRSHVSHASAALWVVMLLCLGFVAVLATTALISRRPPGK